MKKKTKRFLCIILAIVMVLSLSACGNQKSNHFWASKYVCGDGSTIYFKTNGSFEWYQDEANSDAVKSGTYEVSFGEDAKKLLITDYKKYGITEEELDEYAKRNEGDDLHSAENLTLLVLTTTSLKSGGVEKQTGTKTNPYYGYSNETVYDAVNMNSGNYATFNVAE